MPALAAGRLIDILRKGGSEDAFQAEPAQSMRLIYCYCPPRDPLPLAACRRDINRAAEVGCHEPPRGVKMPRSFSWAAIARTLVKPWDRRSSTMALRFGGQSERDASCRATVRLLPTCLNLGRPFALRIARSVAAAQ